MNTLTETVERLVGDRSIRETARDTGVAASYISGILKGTYMPSAEILSKLTVKAQNGVTKEELMVAAGYLDNRKENEMETAIRDMCKKVARNGLLDVSEEAIVDYQDMIGHATMEENANLANDPALMESFYRIYGLAYGTVAAIKFYMQNSEKVMELKADLEYQKDKVEQLRTQLVAEQKTAQFWNDKADEYKGRLEEAKRDMEGTVKSLHEKEDEIVALKAKLYDLEELKIAELK